jgi:hypothetical protein
MKDEKSAERTMMTKLIKTTSLHQSNAVARNQLEERRLNHNLTSLDSEIRRAITNQVKSVDDLQDSFRTVSITTGSSKPILQTRLIKSAQPAQNRRNYSDAAKLKSATINSNFYTSSFLTESNLKSASSSDRNRMATAYDTFEKSFHNDITDISDISDVDSNDSADFGFRPVPIVRSGDNNNYNNNNDINSYYNSNNINNKFANSNQQSTQSKIRPKSSYVPKSTSLYAATAPSDLANKFTTSVEGFSERKLMRRIDAACSSRDCKPKEKRNPGFKVQINDDSDDDDLKAWWKFKSENKRRREAGVEFVDKKQERTYNAILAHKDRIPKHDAESIKERMMVDPVFAKRYKQHMASRQCGKPADFDPNDNNFKLLMPKLAIEREKQKIIIRPESGKEAIRRVNEMQLKAINHKVDAFVQNLKSASFSQNYC